MIVLNMPRFSRRRRVDPLIKDPVLARKRPPSSFTRASYNWTFNFSALNSRCSANAAAISWMDLLSRNAQVYTSLGRSTYPNGLPWERNILVENDLAFATLEGTQCHVEWIKSEKYMFTVYLKYYLHTYILCIYIYISIYIYLYIYIYIPSQYIYIYIYIFLYVYILLIYIYIFYLYIYIYIQIYTYIYIYST